MNRVIKVQGNSCGKTLRKSLKTLSLHILNSYQVSLLTGIHNLVLRLENSRQDTSGGSKSFVRKKEFELQKVSIQTH